MQVPVITPSVRLEALPGARLSGTDPSAMGANLGRGVQQAAGVFSQIAVEERQKRIEAEVTGGLNQLDGYANKKTREALDPENGIRGASAKDDLGRLTKDYDIAVGQVEGKLTDPEAKRQFSLRAGQRRNAYTESLMRHADGVTLAYEDDQDKSAMKLADERVGLHYDDPEQVALARGDKEQALARRAQRNGWSPERLALERQQATSAMHMEALRGYLGAGRATDAEQYFKALKPEEMTAADRKTAQDVVMQQSDTAKAQGIADDAHTRVRAGMLKPTEVEDWLKEQTGDNVRQRDDARNRLKVLQNSYEAAVKEEVDNADLRAMQLLTESGGDITAVKSDPDIMGVWNRHAPEKIRAAEKAASGWNAPQKTDDFAWLSLYNADPADIAKMDPLAFHAEFRGKFSEQDWDNAVAFWGKARDAARQPAKKIEMQEFVTVRDQIDGAIVAARLKPENKPESRWSYEEAGKIVDFQVEAQRRMSMAVTDPKTGDAVKKLNVKERQEILDQMVLEEFRAKSANRLPAWQRAPDYSDIKKKDPEVFGKLRDLAASKEVGNPNVSGEAIEQAYRAGKMRRPLAEIKAILREGK